MKKYSKETVVGIFVVIGLAAIGFMTAKLGNVSLLGDNRYSLFASFGKVTGLRVGSPVNMLGLEIGKVEGLSLNQENQLAVAQFKIRNGIRVYDDAIASIKTEGLIGERYVEIDPGGAGEQLPPGGTIIETESPVDLQEIVSKYAFGSVGKE